MYYFKKYTIIIVGFIPLMSLAQEEAGRSQLMNISLPENSKRETRADIISIHVGRAESFASQNNVSLDKSATELLYTNTDMFFGRLGKAGWSVTATAEPDYYFINKGAQKFLAVLLGELKQPRPNAGSYFLACNSSAWALGILIIKRR